MVGCVDVSSPVSFAAPRIVMKFRHRRKPGSGGKEFGRVYTRRTHGRALPVRVAAGQVVLMDPDRNASSTEENSLETGQGWLGFDVGCIISLLVPIRSRASHRFLGIPFDIAAYSLRLNFSHWCVRVEFQRAPAADTQHAHHPYPVLSQSHDHPREGAMRAVHKVRRHACDQNVAHCVLQRSLSLIGILSFDVRKHECSLAQVVAEILLRVPVIRRDEHLHFLLRVC